MDGRSPFAVVPGGWPQNIERMYKWRVHQWQLDKNSKDSEMRAMYYAAKRREAAGKATAFFVRGRRKELVAVKTYFARKGVDLSELDDEDDVVELPRHIRSVTPIQLTPELAYSASSSDESKTGGSRRYVATTPSPTSQQGSSASSMSLIPFNSGQLKLPVSMLVGSDAIPRSPPSSADLNNLTLSLSNSSSYFSTMFASDYWLLSKINYPLHGQPDLQPMPWAASQVAASYSIAQGDNTSIFSLLDTSSSSLAHVLRQQRPELVPCLLWVLSEFEAAGQKEVSNNVFSYAAELSDIILGRQHPLTQIIWSLYASESRLLLVEPILRQVLRLFESQLDRHHETILYLYEMAANLMRLQKRYAEAESFMIEVIRRNEEASGPNSRATCAAVLSSAEIPVESGKPAQSHTILLDVLKRIEHDPDDDFRNVMKARVFFFLCVIERGRGNHAKAKEAGDEAIRVARMVWPDDSPSMKFWLKRIGR
ncbi:MAG: hypothetical protein Q9227_004374 [Pyrenula ochraceoflavens]